MTKLVLALLIFNWAAYATGAENVGRYSNMNQSTGTYNLIRSNNESSRVCPQTVEVEMRSVMKHRILTSTITVGNVVSIALTNRTMPVSGSTHCPRVEYDSYNDSYGWAEERSAKICGNRVSQRSYKKIAFNSNLKTIRVLIKKDKRTDISCTWEKAD